MKIKKIKLKKAEEILKKLPRALAEHTFLTFLGLLLISLIFGGFIFFQYRVSVQTHIETTGEEKLLKFEEKTYQIILKEWQARNKRFLEADLKEYPNPFKVD